MKRFSLLLFLSILGCAGVTPAPTPGPGEYTCETYCAHAKQMGCTFSQDAPGDGATCTTVCEDATAVVRWDLQCRSTAETCDRINACERK